MGHWFLEEDMLDSCGVYWVGPTQLLLDWEHACDGRTGWNVEEVELSRTLTEDSVGIVGVEFSLYFVGGILIRSKLTDSPPRFMISYGRIT